MQFEFRKKFHLPFQLYSVSIRQVWRRHQLNVMDCCRSLVLHLLVIKYKIVLSHKKYNYLDTYRQDYTAQKQNELLINKKAAVEREQKHKCSLFATTQLEHSHKQLPSLTKNNTLNLLEEMQAFFGSNFYRGVNGDSGSSSSPSAKDVLLQPPREAHACG